MPRLIGKSALSILTLSMLGHGWTRTKHQATTFRFTTSASVTCRACMILTTNSRSMRIRSLSSDYGRHLRRQGAHRLRRYYGSRSGELSDSNWRRTFVRGRNRCERLDPQIGALLRQWPWKPVDTHRLAVGTMLDRYESWYTYAEQVKPGDAAVLSIKSQASGKIDSYRVSWQVIGVPLFQEGPLSGSGAAVSSQTGNFRSMRDRARAANGTWGIWNGPLPARHPKHHSTITQFSRADAEPNARRGNLHFDSMFPSFNPPPGFRLRLNFTRHG